MCHHMGTSRGHMENKTIALLEKQRQDLVIRVLKKHEEVETGRLLTEQILEGISEFFLLFDKSFCLLQTNGEFLRQFGAASVAGKKGNAAKKSLYIHDVFTEDSVQRIRQQFLNDNYAELEAEFVKKGEKKPVRVRPFLHTTPDGSFFYMLLCTDLSELYRLMDRVRDGQKQLMHSGRLVNLGKITAGIGHELTQPLNTILLLARNAIKMMHAAEIPFEQVQKNLEIIADRAERAGSIIETMRGFGRRVEGNLIVVEVNALLRKILTFLDGQLRVNEVHLEVHLGEQQFPVRVVEVRLEQVFLNLVQNAVQAMGQVDKPHLTISTELGERLNIKNMQNEPCVVIRVQDNGEGIDEEMQKKIFDPFFTTRTAGSGMGLGLALVDQIIREFEGYVEVVSSLGEGACFSVHLPLAGLEVEKEKGDNRNAKRA